MKNGKLLRGIACLLVVVLLLGCFSGCKSNNESGVGGVVDMNGVAGNEIEIDIPDATDKDDNNDDQTNVPSGGDQQGDQTETPDETPKDDQTTEEPKDDKEEPKDDQEASKDDKEEEPNYEDLFKEEEVVKPAYDESKELVIVSYNIKNAWGGKTIDQIVSQINAAGADIVGFQEVDYLASRSKNVDQIATIAGKAGFKYFYFEPVIELGSSTEPASENAEKNLYGHAVMSKYPIKKSEIIWPKAQSNGGEVRNFGRHEIDVDGTIIAFYNTHLDFQKGRDQYLEVQTAYMENDEYAICVGDFNENYSEFGSYFNSDMFYNFTFGPDCENVLQRTNVDTGKKSQYIDHIIVTKDKFVWKDGGEGNGLFVTPHDGASDHNMIYAHLNIIK